VELKDGNFKPYTKFDNDVQTSSIDVTIDATAKATLEGEVSVLLYGITGPTLSAEVWAQLEAGFPRNPTWELTAGLDWFIGVKLDLFGLVNLEWDDRLGGLKWDIAEAANTKPIVTVHEPVDGEEMTLPNLFTPLSPFASRISVINETYEVPIRVKSEDAQDGRNCCTLKWYVDDVLKLTTQPGSGHDPTLTISRSTPNTESEKKHEIRIESTDSNGATSTKRFKIKIHKCENTVTFVGGGKGCILQAPFNPLPYPYPLPTTW
jgi:hypothetical protein